MSENIKDRFGRECFEYKGALFPVDGFFLEEIERLSSIFDELAENNSKMPVKNTKKLCINENARKQKNKNDVAFEIFEFGNRKPLKWYVAEFEKVHVYDFTDRYDNKIDCKCMNNVYKRLNSYRREVFNNSKAVDHQFQYADMSSEFMRKCSKYADCFEIGIKQFSLLLFGDVGRGKTYAAACIANRLIDKGFSVLFTSISKFERGLWAEYVDKSTIYNELTKPDLLVIDDLASERDTDYMHEIQFNMIQTRLECGKPMIITTNLTAQQLTKPDDLRMARVNSRILENSYALLCEGKDRRLENFKDNCQYYEQILNIDGRSTDKQP